MKHLKLFEAFRLYKSGDYVFLNKNLKTKNLKTKNLDDKYIIPSDVAKIFDVNYSKFSEFPYKIEYANGIKDQINKNNILRIATIEEIEEYETIHNSNKYNL